VDATVETATARVERPGFAPQEYRVQGRVRYQDGQPVRFDGVEVAGDGLRLAASGSAGLEEGGPIAVTFDAEAEPRVLAAGTPPGGVVRARGNVALPEGSGKVAVTAEAVPAEVARPYMEAKLFSDLSLAGTVADARAEVTLGPGSLAKAAGGGEATWRRGRRRLARAEVQVVPEGEAAEAVRLVFAGDLLPDSPGKRAVRGTLQAASLAEIAAAVAEEARAEVRIADVKAALAEVRALWPRLVPAVPEGVPVQGSLAADLRMTGRLDAPQAKLDASWVPEPGSRVAVKAEGQPLAQSGKANVQLENLSLGVLGGLAPGLSGIASGTADLSGGPRGYQTRVNATVAGVGYPPSLERLETATVAAEGVLRIDPLVYDGRVSVDGAGLFATTNASGTARVERFQLVADGTLNGAPLGYAGTLSFDGAGVEVPGTARVETLLLAADGTFKAEPLSYTGSVSGGGTGLEAPGTAVVDRFEVAADGTFAGDLRSLAGKARLDAGRVTLTAAETEVRDLHLEAEGDGREVRISSLSGSLPEERTFAGSGRVLLEPLLGEADLVVRLVRPVDAVPAAEVTATLRGGVVELSAPGVETATGPVTVRATVPLGALRQVPQLAEKLSGLPLTFTPGPVSVSLAIPELDSEKLLPAFGMEPRAERVRGGVTADFTFDPSAPAAGSGEVRIAGLTAETPQARVTSEGTIVARLGGGRLEVPPVHLRVDGAGIEGAGVDVRGAADLDRAWSPFDDPPASVVTRVDVQGNGTIEASLLNPFLEGGVASGSLTFSAKASGPPDALVADVEARGPGAAFFWPTPYATRLEDVELAASLRDGRLTIREGKAKLNGGTLSLSGGRSPEGQVDVTADFSGVRFRVDYGLLAQLSGKLAFRMPAEGRSRLTGKVVVERGVLDRDVNLDREVLALLFQPDDSPGTEESFLDTVDVALAIETVDGVRVRNNVGDLRASWESIAVSGTLENPVIKGRIDVEPGGLFYAYGQTVRIDRGSVLFTGDPLTDPRLDLATTSSLEDPTIATLRGSDEGFLSELASGTEKTRLEDDEGTPDLQDAVAAGLTGYYGGRFVSSLGESLGLRGISVRPVLVLGEADPSARLTVGRDLSRNVFFALSLDLRNAEDQIYLVDLHGFRGLPRLSAQAFTNQEGGEGGSLQQVLEFGGSPARRAEGPRLRRLRVKAGPGVSARALRRSLRLAKGDTVPAGTAFDVEVELADALRRRGFPDPRITVAVTPVEPRPGFVDVAVEVDPGPKVSFVFEGDRPPRGSRGEITGLYRPDFYEPTSVEEMKKTAVSVFRSLGHLDPEVEIEVRQERPEDPDGPRTVTVRSQAGPKVKIEELVIEGIDPEDARAVASRFPGTLSRVELAAAQPGADRRLLEALRTLGWPEARITGHTFRRPRLVVRVEPGGRQVLGEVDLTGVEGEEARRLRELLAVRSGEPARQALLAQGALALEADLRSRGFADATARPVLRPRPEQPLVVDVTYEVAPGRSYEVAGVEFKGERWTSPGLLDRVVDLSPGELLDGAALDQARQEIFGLGVFSRVTADVEKGEDGTARVSFSLTEKPRFRFGYGVRSESEEGTGAVVDFVDSNFLGRAMTLGLRGLYKDKDRSARLYLQTGGLLGTPVSFESFLLVRRRLPEENLVEDREELSLQLARPFGRRWTGRLYSRYRTSHTVVTFDPSTPPFDIELSIPLLGTQLLYDSRDDLFDPTSGLFASLDLSGSGSWLGSDFDFARAFGQVSDFRRITLAGRPLLWAQGLRLGVAQAFRDQDLVYQERFFAGGEFSVRGYETELLGPLESLGEDLVQALGGTALLVINQELRVPLPFDLTGLVFFDAGQVWDDTGDFGTGLAKSVGLGFRAKSPIGLLRFDAAYPLDRRERDPRYKLYFGFGNTF